VIHCHHYLNRALFRLFPGALAPAGLVALCHPTLTNLERNERPGRHYLYELGEMRRLAEDGGLRIVQHEESWGTNDKHEARLIARRP